MCGIAGKVYFQKKRRSRNTEILLIEKTLEKLNHRGPDDCGYFLDKNIWLAAARLKIIDLSPAGHQPIQNEDKSLILVFNGEMYNYREMKERLRKRHKFISHTDSEVLLHLYEEYGIDCLKFLRGMFAFAIWDRKKKELFLARDRLGKKPLKYYFNGKFFVFASELKAFIDHPGVTKEIDEAAIKEFLSFGYISSPRTGFKNIYKLPPAHYMIIKANGVINIQKYWSINFDQKIDLSEIEWEKLIEEKLKESVRLRLRSDVPVGVHLSGGIDSGLITGFAASESKNPITTVSVGFGDKEFNELPYARLVAGKYHTNHHEIVVKSEIDEIFPQLSYQYEEPFADPSIIPTWFLMKESKKYFTVALNGDGGDENFLGYRRYQILKWFQYLRYIPKKKSITEVSRLFYQIFKKEDFNHIARILSLPYSDISHFFHAQRSLHGKFSKNQKTEISTIEDMQRFEFENYLPDDLLSKVDIASMAHSLEVRSPFLDHEFVGLVAQMPFSLKLHGFTTKYLLKKIAYRYLPKDLIDRKKQGFLPPLAHWIREEKKEYFFRELTDVSFLAYGMISKNAIMKLLNEHIDYKANHAYALFTLLCLKQWFKTWFQN